MKSGSLLFTSEHTSELCGKLGAGVTTEQGYAAARQAVGSVLDTIHREVGSLKGIRVIRLLGCVNAVPDFLECPKVINGVCDLIHAIFGA